MMGGNDDGEDEGKYFHEQVCLAEELHDRAIDLCYGHNDHEQALIELRKAVLLRESLLGKNHNDTAISYFRMATILREKKNADYEALVVARREIRISQNLMIVNFPFPSLAGSSSSESGTRRPSTRDRPSDWMVERIEWIEDVVKGTTARAMKMNGCDPSKYCSQLLKSIEFEQVGDEYCKSSEWEQAIAQYSCALTLESTAYARNNADIADLHVKLGVCFVNIDELDAAADEFRYSQEKYQGEFGPHHATVGHVLSKQASICLKRRKFDNALAFYARAYSIYEESYGKEHRLSIETLNDIRLVTVKEMEDLRRRERHRIKDEKKHSGKLINSI